MGMQFTEEQQEVIDLRDCNILVSAAAGSGKTAVLTERIVNMVCDEENPVDIDRLLVVTFTSAAAAEMRERIGNKLSERLELHPESVHLQRQMTLLHNAQITTIDSFCLFLVRNHFHEIGLDPAFRVADEREIKLMRQEVLGELLEDAFAEGRPEFIAMVEALCPRGKEKVLEEHILNLSRYAASFPWPEKWLLQRKEDYGALTAKELENASFWAYLQHYVGSMLQGCINKLDRAVGLTQDPDGPYMYGELLEKEKEDLEAIAQKQSLQEMGLGIEKMTFGKLSSKKDDSVNAAKRNEAKVLRDEVKKVIAELEEQVFVWPMETILRQGKDCCIVAQELVELVLDFDRRMKEKKSAKKIIDFTDMEHFALDILLKREEGTIRPSQVAKQYREYFHEILIDEYQDSNLVQEYLLRAVSGEEEGCFNRFMVGDVKQSIYRFRLARPELFLEKYDTYQPHCKSVEREEQQPAGHLRRIDLSKNFRSRKEVVETVNQVFGRLMSREVGGISYDAAAALYVGASYPAWKDQGSELMIVQKPERGGALENRQAEALAVAGRIRRLVQEQQVTDKETGKLRNAGYRDIVILLRSLSNMGDIYKEALESQGIPAYVTSKTGYFTAAEVQDLLNFLRIIDNPLQDIPLYGVLRSYFGGFTEEEIAGIRGGEKKRPLYEQLRESALPGIKDFLERLEQYREMSGYLTIRGLLERIVWDYDYLNFLAALPGGAKRRANVEMLFVKASDFEKTSYYGLFHFMRYMDQLEKYEEDFGEADTLDENADVVRIMSIHKSKGLEFPVVFVSGLSKSFNMQDSRPAVILDMDLGLGMDFVNTKRRIKGKTLRKNAVALKLKEDMLSEELRLFYVALTRAKEKLILTAEVAKPQEKYGEDDGFSGREEKLSYLDFMKAQSYLDFLNPVLRQIKWDLQVIGMEDLQVEKTVEQMDLHLARERLACAGGAEEAEEQRLLEERFAFTYPHGALKGLYTKTTVSELKMAAMSEQEEGAFHLFEERETEEYLPAFRRGDEGVSGTVRGNAYHRVMELLDFGKVLNDIVFEEQESLQKSGAGQGDGRMDYQTYLSRLKEERVIASLKEFLKAETESQRLSEEYLQAVRLPRIYAFISSELGYRMWRAEQRGTLRREQPFVLSIPARRLKAEFPEEERVLIQGIIDAYFEEDGEIVLLDYKTDSVGSSDQLWKRYRTQMDYYQEALERLTGLHVKKRYLYSFHLGEANDGERED